MKRLLILIITLFLIGCTDEKDKGIVERGFNDEKLERLAKTNQFNYDRIIKPAENPVLDFVALIFRGVGWFLSNIFGYLVIAVILILLVWLIINNAKIKAKEDRPPEATLRTFENEGIADIDFKPLLEEALNSGDFRLAIRYTYLDILKKLYQVKAIEIKDSKTNHEYYYELDISYKADYLKILRLFEFVWYGEFPANQTIYSTFADDCSDFREKIEQTNG